MRRIFHVADAIVVERISEAERAPLLAERECGFVFRVREAVESSAGVMPGQSNPECEDRKTLEGPFPESRVVNGVS